MKIMWISNRRLDINKKNGYGGGWLTSLMTILSKKPDVELHVCYVDRKLKDVLRIESDGVWHYGLPRKKHVMKYDKSLEPIFADLIDEIQPDIIHIQGTENANGIVAMNVRPDKVYTVSIQGLIGRYSEHYVGGVPLPYCLDLTLRDLLHRDGPISKGRKFRKSSWYESEMLRRAPYIMARTNWDIACAHHENRDAVIYNDVRVLRPSFYENKWSLDTCKKHSIFVGSSQNQIKGLHYVLQALPLILKVFPDTQLYISSPDFIHVKSFKDLAMYQSYWIYLRKIIKKYKLWDNIHFMGVLDEKGMCRAFLDAHVFILPSVIENSPNTLSEAAVLGVPTVSSFIAGVPDVVENGVNGWMYAYDEYYIMAEQVIQLFSNDEMAKSFSEKLREKALKKYDPNQNTDAVYEAYQDIIRRENNGKV